MGNRHKGYKNQKNASEFDQRIIDLARVTRVMAGGKRLRFRACVVIGDKKGRVGWAVAKAADVAEAVNKAVNKAKKNLVTVPLINETIPHEYTGKFNAARVMLKPARAGIGIIAGGAVRSVLELAGIPNVYGKILGNTSNKINNVAATFKIFEYLKTTSIPEEKKSAETEAEQKILDNEENKAKSADGGAELKKK